MLLDMGHCQQQMNYKILINHETVKVKTTNVSLIFWGASKRLTFYYRQKEGQEEAPNVTSTHQ